VAQAREVQLPLDVEALLEFSREALSSFAVEMGLGVGRVEIEAVRRAAGGGHPAGRS